MSDPLTMALAVMDDYIDALNRNDEAAANAACHNHTVIVFHSGIC